jgi:hypothetical protein
MSLLSSGGFATGCAAGETVYDGVCSDCGAEVLPDPGYCPNLCETKPLTMLRVLCPSWEEAKSDG